MYYTTKCVNCKEGRVLAIFYQFLLYNGGMDKYIKQSIDARKDALSASYKIDAGIQKKIDALFDEIEKLGDSCKDVGEFETEFARSSLNQKYLDLFTEVATNCQATAAAPKVDKSSIGKMVAGGTVAGVAESAADDVIRNVAPTRAAVNQKFHDEVQDIPVVGDAVDVAQKAGYVGHLAKLFKKKKK